MADLSHLLGDVYGDAGATTPDDGPAWADESRLDDAFAAWVPGPAADAPAVERELLAAVTGAPTSVGQPLDDDLAAALSAALADVPETFTAPRADTAAPAAEPVPAPVSFEPAAPSVAEAPPVIVEAVAPAAAERRTWRPEDDEILPGARARGAKAASPRTGRLRLKLR